MVINPFYLLLFLFLASIFSTFLNGVEMEGFYILSNFHYVSRESYIAALLVEVLVLAFIAIIYFFTNACRFENKIWLGSFWAVFLIINQIAYILFVSITGAGVAGSGFSFNGFNVFNYYFIAINPDLLSFLIIPLLRSKKMVAVTLALLLISYFIRGWLGGVTFFVILYLIRFYPVVVSKKYAFYILLCLLFAIFLMPFLVAMKWGVRLGHSWLDMFYGTAIEYDVSIILDSFKLVFERFSHINYTAYVYENLDAIRLDYNSDKFKHYIENGILYEVYCRVFDSCYSDVNSYLVREYIDPLGKDWNLDIGVAGWIFILGVDGFLLLFILVFLVLIFRVVVFRCFGYIYANLFFVLSLIYYFNSWFSPYYNFVLYLLVFSVVFRMNLLSRGYYVR